ncbi:MAG: hypothetical protein LBR07_02195, partial [Puniceicoccales bacterium]|nr:hypothetical protein [Puniceicoccales bacterium]
GTTQVLRTLTTAAGTVVKLGDTTPGKLTVTDFTNGEGITGAIALGAGGEFNYGGGTLGDQTNTNDAFFTVIADGTGNPIRAKINFTGSATAANPAAQAVRLQQGSPTPTAGVPLAADITIAAGVTLLVTAANALGDTAAVTVLNDGALTLAASDTVNAAIKTISLPKAELSISRSLTDTTTVAANHTAVTLTNTANDLRLVRITPNAELLISDPAQLGDRASVEIAGAATATIAGDSSTVVPAAALVFDTAGNDFTAATGTAFKTAVNGMTDSNGAYTAGEFVKRGAGALEVTRVNIARVRLEDGTLIAATAGALGTAPVVIGNATATGNTAADGAPVLEIANATFANRLEIAGAGGSVSITGSTAAGSTLYFDSPIIAHAPAAGDDGRDATDNGLLDDGGRQPAANVAGSLAVHIAAGSVTLGTVITDTGTTGGVPTAAVEWLIGASATGGTAAAATLIANDDSNGAAAVLAKLGTGAITFAPTAAGDASALHINATSALALDNLIAGAGTVAIDLGSTARALTFKTAGAFTGTLSLTNATLSLGATSSVPAIYGGSARLVLNSGAFLDASAGAHSIRALTFDGGALALTLGSPLTLTDTAAGTATVVPPTTAATAAGTIRLANAAALTATPPLTTTPLVSQDDGAAAITLIDAQNAAAGFTAADVAHLALRDAAGNALPTVTADLQLAGASNTPAARGTYAITLAAGTAATGTAGDLLAAVTLTELHLLKTIATNGTAETTVLEFTGSDDFKAKITGTGDLRINDNGASGTLVLTNSASDYTGRTVVESGFVRAGISHAFGNTSSLEIGDGGSAWLDDDVSQTIGAGGITISAINESSELALQEGASLISAGPLTISGTAAFVSVIGLAANTSLYVAGNATLDEHSRIYPEPGSTLTLAGLTNTLAGEITGTGSDHLALTNPAFDPANAAATTATTVITGAGNLVSTSLLTVANGVTATFTGAGTLGSPRVVNAGVITVANDTGAFTASTISNSGTLNLRPPATGTAITYSGALTGTGDVVIGDAATGAFSKVAFTNTANDLAQVTIAAGASLAITTPANLGANATVTLDAPLTAGAPAAFGALLALETAGTHATPSVMWAIPVNGGGTFRKTGGGTIELADATGAAPYTLATGALELINGTVIAEEPRALSPATAIVIGNDNAAINARPELHLANATIASPITIAGHGGNLVITGTAASAALPLYFDSAIANRTAVEAAALPAETATLQPEATGDAALYVYIPEGRVTLGTTIAAGTTVNWILGIDNLGNFSTATLTADDEGAGAAALLTKIGTGYIDTGFTAPSGRSAVNLSATGDLAIPNRIYGEGIVSIALHGATTPSLTFTNSTQVAGDFYGTLALENAALDLGTATTSVSAIYGRSARISLGASAFLDSSGTEHTIRSITFDGGSLALTLGSPLTLTGEGVGLSSVDNGAAVVPQTSAAAGVYAGTIHLAGAENLASTLANPPLNLSLLEQDDASGG